MRPPIRWARGDRAVIYVTVDDEGAGVATVRLPDGERRTIATENLSMVSPDDPNHSAQKARRYR